MGSLCDAFLSGNSSLALFKEPFLVGAGWGLGAPRGRAEQAGAHLCAARAAAALGKPAGKGLNTAGRRWVWPLAILASRWWQANRCDTEPGASARPTPAVACAPTRHGRRQGGERRRLVTFNY